MNRKKVGRPYRLVPRLPSSDYSGLRRSILRLDPPLWRRAYNTEGDLLSSRLRELVDPANLGC